MGQTITTEEAPIMGIDTDHYISHVSDIKNEEGHSIIKPDIKTIQQAMTDHGQTVKVSDPKSMGLNSVLPLPVDYFAYAYNSLFGILGQTLIMQAVTHDNITPILVGGCQFGIKQLVQLHVEDCGGDTKFVQRYRINPMEMTLFINIAVFAYFTKQYSWAVKLVSVCGSFATAEVWSLLMSILKTLFGWLSPDIDKFFAGAMHLGGMVMDASRGESV